MDVWSQLTEKQRDTCNFEPLGPVRLGGIGGVTIPIIGVVSLKLKLRLDGPKRERLFALVDHNVIPSCCLLGLNILKLLKAEFDYRRSQISFMIGEDRHQMPMKDVAAGSSESIQMAGLLWNISWNHQTDI